MMFIDYARIYVKAGQGGSGACSFRREKHVAKGGPNGGDGGKGGDIIIAVDPHLHTLIDFKYKKHYAARHGQHGMGKNRHGRDAEDVIIKVPLGTVIKDAETETVLADMIYPDSTFIVAEGGKGGRGNARFATPTHQAPREWEVGEPGEEHLLILELKLLADVGIVGLPNSGKSTLLSKLSAAKPKIAAYPFTTITPNLGIVKVEDYKSFVMADIPGLIEGAHQGKGLGLQFLRHIERTRVLVFLIDPMQGDPVETYGSLRDELEKYDSRQISKPHLIVLSKSDTWDEDFIEKYRAKLDRPFESISAATGQGLKHLVSKIHQLLEEVNSNKN